MELKESTLDLQLDSQKRNLEDANVSAEIRERVLNYHSIKSALKELTFQDDISELEKLPRVTKLTRVHKRNSAEGSLGLLRGPGKDFKRNFVKLSGVYNAINLDWSKKYIYQDTAKELDRITPDVGVKKQLESNPIFVDSNGKLLDIGTRTKLMVERQRTKGVIVEIEGILFLKGRHLIGAKTPINLGVYPGSGIDREGKYIREILVVDYNKDIALQVFYNEFVSQVETSGKKDIISVISLYDKMIGPMINLKNSLTLEKKYANKKVELGAFLAQGAIVCRHSALLFAAVMERMQLSGVLPYKVDCTLTRINDFWTDSQRGKHIYCKLQVDGRVFIVDPVQNCSGPLEIVGKIKPYAAEGDLWNHFSLGQDVNVFRNNTVLESDWTIESIKERTNSHFDDLITVSKIVESAKLIKTISFDTLRGWQLIRDNN